MLYEIILICFGETPDELSVPFEPGVRNYEIEDINGLTAFVPIQFIAGRAVDLNGNPVPNAPVLIKYENSVLGETTTNGEGLFRICIYLPFSWVEAGNSIDISERILTVEISGTAFYYDIPIANFRGSTDFQNEYPVDEQGRSLELNVTVQCEVTELYPDVSGLKILSTLQYDIYSYGDASCDVLFNVLRHRFLRLWNYSSWGNGWGSVAFELREPINISGYDRIKAVVLVENDVESVNFQINLRDPTWTDYYHVQAHTQTATVPAGNGSGGFRVIDISLNNLTNVWGNDGNLDRTRVNHIAIELGRGVGNYSDKKILLYDLILSNGSSSKSLINIVKKKSVKNIKHRESK